MNHQIPGRAFDGDEERARAEIMLTLLGIKALIETEWPPSATTEAMVDLETARLVEFDAIVVRGDDDAVIEVDPRRLVMAVVDLLGLIAGEVHARAGEATDTAIFEDLRTTLEARTRRGPNGDDEVDP